MNTSLIEEKNYLYFRFKITALLEKKILTLLTKELRSTNNKLDTLFTQKTANIYLDILNLNRLEEFINIIKDTNATLYCVKINPDTIKKEDLLKELQAQATIFFNHEVKIRFLFKHIPKALDQADEIKHLFFDYLSVEITQQAFDVEEEHKSSSLSYKSLPTNQFQKYIFCQPSLMTSLLCKDIIKRHHFTEKRIPTLMHSSCLFRVTLIHDLKEHDFHGYINTRINLLSQVIYNSVQQELTGDNTQSKQEYKKTIESWLKEIKNVKNNSFINYYNLNFYDDIVQLPELN